MNTFPYSSDNKRYHTLNYHNRAKYGEKVYKAVINCGLTCPNIDSTKGCGGCIFCDGGSGYFTSPALSVPEQLEREYARISAKYGDVPVTAYFQANTNTYAPVEKLREMFLSVLTYPYVKGIAIGTRADCLPDDVMGLLTQINERTQLTVELGMQTVHDSTLELINRCCTHSEFVAGFEKLQNMNIRTCLHIINGLPGETADMMRETARQTAMMHPQAVKLQMLHVIKGTRLADMYANSEITLLSKDEYISIIADQLELLPPDIVIERITGDGDKKKLVAPMWTADKIAVLGGIDKELTRRDSYQGIKYRDDL